MCLGSDGGSSRRVPECLMQQTLSQEVEAVENASGQVLAGTLRVVLSQRSRGQLRNGARQILGLEHEVERGPWTEKIHREAPTGLDLTAAVSTTLPVKPHAGLGDRLGCHKRSLPQGGRWHSNGGCTGKAICCEARTSRRPSTGGVWASSALRESLHGAASRPLPHDLDGVYPSERRPVLRRAIAGCGVTLGPSR